MHVLLIGGPKHDQLFEVDRLVERIRILVPPTLTLQAAAEPSTNPRDEGPRTVTYCLARRAIALEAVEHGYEAVYESEGWRLQQGPVRSLTG